MNQHVQFNYLRQNGEKGEPIGHSSFLVTISDLALAHLSLDHPVRYLVHRWNGCAPASMRVQALADALREFEARQLVEETAKGGAFARLAGRCIRNGFASAFVVGFLSGSVFIAGIWLLTR